MSLRKYGAVRFGLVFATLSLATNQTLTTETATIALSAPSATLSTGPGTSHHVPFQRPVFQRGLRWFGPTGYSASPISAQTLTANGQTIALSAPDAVLAAGGVSLSAGANTLSLSAPAATLSAAGIPHHVPFMRPVFQRGLRWFGPVGYSATPGLNQSLTFGAQTLAISAPDAVRAAGGVTLSAGAQALALSAPTVTLTAGGSALAAGAQTLALSAPTATLSGGAAPSIGVLFQRPVFQRGIRAYGPPSLSTTPDVNRTLDVSGQTIALSAPQATLTSPGVSTIVETLRFRFVKGRHVKRFGGWAQVNLVIVEPASDAQAQTLTASAQVLAVSAPTATRSAGAVSLSAGAQTLAMSAPAVTRTAGTSTLTASAQTIALSAPSVSVVQEGVLVLGSQTIAISAPTATATGGAVSRTTGANVIAISARTATIGQSLNTNGNTISLSARQATLVVGAATVQAGTQTLAISAPQTSVLGATTLPDMVSTALESRQPERTLARRNGVRVLDTRNGERTVEFNG